MEYVIFPVVKEKRTLIRMTYYPASAWIVHNRKILFSNMKIQMTAADF